MTAPGPLDPFWAGLRGLCPHCGKGRLFSGFLTLEAICLACGHDFAEVDSGDGPAVFVIMVVGFIIVFGALATEIAFDPPVWVDLVVWLPLGAVLCLGLLRPMKGLMIAAQIQNRGSRGPKP